MNENELRPESGFHVLGQLTLYVRTVKIEPSIA